jgi:hypothetical protein
MNTIPRRCTVRVKIARLFLDWRASAVSSAGLDTPRRSMSTRSHWIFRGVEIGCLFHRRPALPGRPHAPAVERVLNTGGKQRPTQRQFRLDRRHPAPTVTGRTRLGGHMHALVERLYPLCRGAHSLGRRTQPGEDNGARRFAVRCDFACGGRFARRGTLEGANG